MPGDSVWVRAMRFAALALGALAVVVVVGCTLLDSVAERRALQEFRASGERELSCTEYEFVTRGVRYGMTYDEVCLRMPGSEFGVLYKEEGDDETSRALYYFFYGSAAFAPISDWQKWYLAERYIVEFDAAGGATRIDYRLFFNGHHSIDIDLRNKTLSSPLEAPWRSGDCDGSAMQ